MEQSNKPGKPKFSRYFFLITYAIVLFLLLYRIDSVWGAVRWVLHILTPIFLGTMLAFLLHMPMDFFQEKLLGHWAYARSNLLRRLRPVLAMLLAYTSVLLVIYTIIALILPPTVESVGVLATNFGSYLSSFQSWADGIMSSASIDPQVSEIVSEAWQSLVGMMQTVLSQVVSGAFDFTIGLTAGVVDFLFAFILSGYILLTRSSLFSFFTRTGYATIGVQRTNRAREILVLMDQIFSRYTLGRLAETVVVGILCFIGMSILGMDYALLISIVVAVTNIIPIIGPWLGTIPCAIILLVIEPMQALWFVVFVVILQQLENNLVAPRLVGEAIGLPGFWVLVSVIVGGAVWGFWGMLIGTPAAAVLYRLVGEWLDRKEKLSALRP